MNRRFSLPAAGLVMIAGFTFLAISLGWMIFHAGFFTTAGDSTVARLVSRSPVGIAISSSPSKSRIPIAQAHEVPVVKESLDARVAHFIEVANSNIDPEEFEAFLNRWLASLDADEVPRALIALQKVGMVEEFATDIDARLVRRWADLDTKAALAWVNTMPKGPARDLALENVAIVRANEALGEASAWARQLPAGAERDRAIFAIATEAVRQHPAAALDLAADLPTDPASDELIRRAAMEWTAKDQPQALEWARQILDEKFRAQVLAGVATAWGDRDPGAAGAFAVKELPAGRLQNDAIVGILQRWAQHDPEAAAAWIDAFPSGGLKSAAVESVAPIWALQDATRAEQWRRAASPRVITR